MKQRKEYRYLNDIPLTIPNVYSILWAKNEQDDRHIVIGCHVGRDAGNKHIYMSLNPDHVKYACTGNISDKERQRLGIEKIVSDFIISITPLQSWHTNETWFNANWSKKINNAPRP